MTPIARVGVAGILVALACSDPAEPEPTLYAEDFEERCDGLPCGWSQIEGDRGQARWVETFHPGEHGIRLSGSGVTVRGPGSDAADASLAFGTLQARLTATCDPGNRLVVRVGLVDASDAGGSPRTDTLEGRTPATVPTDWGAPVTLSLTAVSALGDGGFGASPFLSGRFRITGVTISKEGSGACVISRIVVDDRLPMAAEGC